MPRDDIPRDSTSPLPANTEAEQALLGAMLVNNAAYRRVSGVLAAEEFANPVHSRIYAAIAELVDQGKIANPVTLKNRFDQDGALSEIGGAQYLSRLAESAVTIINAPHYAEIILDNARKRLIIASNQAAVERAFAGGAGDSADDIIADLRDELAVIADRSFNRLNPFNPTELDGVPIPDRPWLVPGWIPIARVTGLYGAGGEGKTLLAQMLATSCAIGVEWIGLPVQKCHSLLCYCEDDRDEMQRRQDDINRAYGCGFYQLGAMRWLPRLGSDNALMDFPDPAATHATIQPVIEGGPRASREAHHCRHACRRLPRK